MASFGEKMQVMSASPLAGNPEFVPRWDVYRAADGKPVTVTPEQCAAIWNAVLVVEAVRKAEGFPSLFAHFDGDPLSVRAEVEKSRLLGRMLYGGLPPTKTKPPRDSGGPEWDLLYGGDPFGPVRPRIEIDLNVRLGEIGTYAGFENVHGAEAADLKRLDRVRAFESESGLEGPAMVQEVNHEKRLVFLLLDWRLLKTADGT